MTYPSLAIPALVNQRWQFYREILYICSYRSQFYSQMSYCRLSNFRSKSDYILILLYFWREIDEWYSHNSYQSHTLEKNSDSNLNKIGKILLKTWKITNSTFKARKLYQNFIKIIYYISNWIYEVFSNVNLWDISIFFHWT